MKKTPLLIVFTLLLASCASFGGNNQNEQLVSMQSTIDALSSQKPAQEATQAVAATSPAPPQNGGGDNANNNAGNENSNEQNNSNQSSTPDTPTPTSAVSRSSALNNITTLEFDNQGPAWETGCYSVRQEMSEFGNGWNENDQWFGANLECEMAFDLPISVNGTYDLYLVATYAPDFGNLQLQVNSGIETYGLPNVSLFDPTVKPTEELFLGKFHFDVNSTSQFVVYMYDKPAQSTDYKFGLDYLKLVLVQPD